MAQRHECLLDMYAGQHGTTGSAQLDLGVRDDLRQARTKTATGNLAHALSPACKLGKVCTDEIRRTIESRYKDVAFAMSNT